MPTVIPTRRSLLTAERAAILVACVAVLCSVFLVVQTVRAEPAATTVAATGSDRSAAAASNDDGHAPWLEAQRRQ